MSSFRLEARRRLSNTASATRAATATTEATPAMMGIAFDAGSCSGEARAFELVPKEGAGVGANKVVASERAGGHQAPGVQL